MVNESNSTIQRNYGRDEITARRQAKEREMIDDDECGLDHSAKAYHELDARTAKMEKALLGILDALKDPAFDMHTVVEINDLARKGLS